MRDAEPTIQRLLTGLRGAEPPAGMERRILDAVNDRGVAASVSWWGMRTRLACVTAVAALCIATVTLLRHPGDTGQLLGGPVHPRSQDRDLGHPPQFGLAPSRVGTTAVRLPRRVHAHKPSPVETLQASGYPAPPLPLTEQEKLLLRLAHRRDQEATALLNDDVRAAQTVKTAEQFQEFFEIDITEKGSESE